VSEREGAKMDRILWSILALLKIPAVHFLIFGICSKFGHFPLLAAGPLPEQNVVLTD
jgi:hypothetical protein